jgi:kumamolisin
VRFRRPVEHRVTVTQGGSRYWWWDCTCGHFGYGHDYDTILRAGVLHVDPASKESTSVSSPGHYSRTPAGLRFPRAASTSYAARQVAAAYGCPVDRYNGAGIKVGIIELGGGFSPADMTTARLANRVTVVSVDGGKPVSDGANGADGEVALDVQVVAGIAPGSDIRLYFAPNTDAGFIDAVAQAAAECDVVSVSWGGPESQWNASSVKKFSAVLAAARAKGVPVFVAAGDAGSTDGTKANVVDYPASDPSAIGCGGTKLSLAADGSRASEVTWDDDDRQSATGGGVSTKFPGRQVPDVAGDASPSTGYGVVIDGGSYVIGGTSAVAPLYAACYAIVKQATGKPFDFVNIVQTNPTICYDVTVGDNGAYKAGPGRDQTTGFGVVDFEKLLTVLTSGTQVPAPGGGTTGTGSGGSAGSGTDDLASFWKWLRSAVGYIDAFLKGKGY